MSRGDGSRRRRKNMNLSLQCFEKLRSVKVRAEGRLKKQVSWDIFFTDVVDVVERRPNR